MSTQAVPITETTPDEDISLLAEMFRLMGDSSRLRIILCCLHEPVSVSDMAAQLGLSQSLVSNHLRLLRGARIVRAERRGKQVFYVAADAHIQCVIEDMVAHVGEHGRTGGGELMVGCTDCPSDTALASGSKDPVFRRVLWIALIVNGGMFVVEIIASALGGSMALQADALDFFGDSANYAISLFVLGMALSARAKAALFKGASMALFGVWVIGAALNRVIDGAVPDAPIMGGIAFAALVANVGVAAILYAYRSGDSNMRSIWLCSRNDAIGNIAVMVAAGGVFATASRWPDLITAILIASLNLSAAVQVIRQALQEIRQEATPTESCEAVACDASCDESHTHAAKNAGLL